VGKKVLVAALIVGAFLVGSGFGWWSRGSQAERDAQLLAAVRSAEVAGLCANVLGATEDRRTATAQELLEMRMVSAVTEAAENVDRASHPQLAFPNLVEGLKRARRYAFEKGMPDVVGKCDRVLAFFATRDARV
jgi:hypothetical protein